MDLYASPHYSGAKPRTHRTAKNKCQAQLCLPVVIQAPDGTFTGQLTGVYQLDGDIKGDVELELTLAGEIEDGGDGSVVPVSGTTTVTGTATSGEGVYDVDLTI